MEEALIGFRIGEPKISKKNDWTSEYNIRAERRAYNIVRTAKCWLE